ncbi:lysophospholipid acyltransferase family protein [Vulgatibacter sp.]|uniref:lysophospholipid acyltransferase family protein n=1 Tax=Vulgatibacter sp. TaxID=1971226 RepID=UPI00356A1D94
MIPAAKSAAFSRWFAGQIRGRMRRSFSAVRVKGAAHASEAAAAGSLLAVSNHTAWWDPLAALVLNEAATKLDGYALMDAKNLRRLPFFARIGGFGADLDRPGDAAAALRYGAKLLREPGRLVWVFPQGRERPISERPLGFASGAAAMARLAQVRTLPVALRYEFGEAEKPELRIAVGAPIDPLPSVDLLASRQERAVVELLDGIDLDLRAGSVEGWETLLEGSAEPLAKLAERWLAFFTRGAVRG